MKANNSALHIMHRNRLKDIGGMVLLASVPLLAVVTSIALMALGLHLLITGDGGIIWGLGLFSMGALPWLEFLGKEVA